MHAASAWQLLVVSIFLQKAVQGRQLKLYLMSATNDTPIYKAVREAMVEAVGEDAILPIHVQPSGRQPTREETAEEIPARLLPALEQLSWPTHVDYIRSKFKPLITMASRPQVSPRVKHRPQQARRRSPTVRVALRTMLPRLCCAWPLQAAQQYKRF